MWTYTTGTVATNAFDTPVVNKIDNITDGTNTVSGKMIFIQDSIPVVKGGHALVKGYTQGAEVIAAKLLSMPRAIPLSRTTRYFIAKPVQLRQSALRLPRPAKL